MQLGRGVVGIAAALHRHVVPDDRDRPAVYPGQAADDAVAGRALAVSGLCGPDERALLEERARIDERRDPVPGGGPAALVNAVDLRPAAHVGADLLASFEKGLYGFGHVRSGSSSAAVGCWRWDGHADRLAFAVTRERA